MEDNIDELSQAGELRNWDELNSDCLANIFERVGTESLITRLPFVCKNWYTASLEPRCWTVLDFSFVREFILDQTFRLLGLDHTLIIVEGLPRLIKLAVDRSQGIATTVVLYHIQIQHDFESALTYISNGCPMLKTLVIPIRSRGCISKLIKKWKDLEHLTIPCVRGFGGTVSEIKTHCKNFASLTIGKYITDKATTTTVTLLPNIRRLNLRGSMITRENLVRILSECKNLEFLDVSCCIGFDADDAEVLKMASHIETFLPQGSVRHGCEYY